MTRLIEARGLVRKFGDFVAVDKVSLAIESGEIVGLLGANGAGKTTTIRMLIGLLVPTSGTASLGGRRPDATARRHLGYVPQGLGLYTDLTVSENLSFVAGAYGVEESVPPPALHEHADRLVGELPLGLQRQLAFACAIQHAPNVLILDEPTSGVGPLGTAELWDRFRVEAEHGSAVLVSTHSMQEARQCDRLVLMASGAVVAEGSEADIVGDTTAMLVTTSAWKDSFEALESAGYQVTLDGRNVRVANANIDALRNSLAAAGIRADVTMVTATLDEKMVAIAAHQTRPS
jgi:ABC-2 type transport system ATP-binding protein